MNLIIIAVSFSIVVLMLVVKLVEIHLGRTMFVTRIISGGDIYIHALTVKFNRAFYFVRELAIFILLVRIPSRIEQFFAKLKRRSLSKYNSLSGKMRGERTLNTKNHASPFIRTLVSRNGINSMDNRRGV